MQSNYDVVVVGAGPAGLAAAECVARAGAATLVLERGDGIGIPTRTSGGSFIAPLRTLGVPADLYRPIQRIRLVMPAGEVAYDYAEPEMCVLDVRRLYQHLAERAVSAGATIRLQARVDGPLMEEGTVGGVHVKGPDQRVETIAARVVVDASGFYSVVAKRAGLHQGFDRFGLGAELDLWAPRFDMAEALLIVGESVAPNGYAWAFPYGTGRVRVGSGVPRPERSDDPRALVAELTAHHPSLAAALENASPIEVHHGLIPFAPPGQVPYVAPGLVVVGDAAGQASALVGEGIRYAMHAGRIAGAAIARGFTAGDLSLARLQEYARAWKRDFHRELLVSYRIHRHIVGFSDAQWERQLPRLRALSPQDFARGLRGDITLPWILGLAARHAVPGDTARRLIGWLRER